MTQSSTILERVGAIVRNMAASGDLLGEVQNDTPLFYDAGNGTRAAALSRGEAGLDSLDMVEIVMAIEEEFELEISDADVSDEDGVKWNTIDAIAAYVERRTLENEGVR